MQSLSSRDFFKDRYYEHEKRKNSAKRTQERMTCDIHERVGNIRLSRLHEFNNQQFSELADGGLLSSSFKRVRCGRKVNKKGRYVPFHIHVIRYSNICACI